MIGIYKIQNLVNNKIYIGQSVDINRRLNEHRRRTEGQIIDEAITKYGQDNFSYEIIEECQIEKLSDRELYWIQYYNSLVPNGYNFSIVKSNYGENNAASKLTDEDIIFIRKCYQNKVYNTSAELWRKNYPELSQATIEAVFFGKSWTHLMMDVYTKELEKYYYKQYLITAIGGRGRKGEDNPMALLTEKDVIEMRVMYQENERKAIFEKFPKYSERAITSIVSNQNWKHLPMYKKREKIWEYPKDWSEEQIEAFKILAKLH